MILWGKKMVDWQEERIDGKLRWVMKYQKLVKRQRGVYRLDWWAKWYQKETGRVFLPLRQPIWGDGKKWIVWWEGKMLWRLVMSSQNGSAWQRRYGRLDWWAKWYQKAIGA
jgi:hypothetical protein